MPYTPTNWVSGTTPASAANLNNIETGIATLDTGKVTKAGDTMTGTLNGTDIVASGNLVCGTGLFINNIIICNAYFGVRKTDGTKLFQSRANGDFTISGVTLRTSAGSSSGYGTGGVFDTFDVAETYPTDTVYAAGTVLMPQDEVYTRCTEDGSPFAVIVSAGGGLQLGPNDEDVDEIAVPIALTGRVRVDTADAVTVRQWVTATDDGRVRAMQAGETAFTLGYALHPTHNGQVGIFLRPCMMTVPSVRVRP